MSGKSSIQQETGQEKERATIWNLPSNTMESILLSCALSSATSSLRNWQISFWNNPVSIPRRKLWFLYEFFTGTLLPLEDADKGNYILLLDPEEYYTLKNGVRSSRHRVINNLTGTVAFCPLIRRTDRLKQVEQTNFIEQCAHSMPIHLNCCAERSAISIQRKPSHPLQLSISNQLLREERNLSPCSHLQKQMISVSAQGFLSCRT